MSCIHTALCHRAVLKERSWLTMGSVPVVSIEILTKSELNGRMMVFPGPVACILTRRGCSVYTYDCEGHGLSESCAGVDDATGLVTDFVELATIACSRHRLPVVGLGASMGDGVVCRAGMEDPSVIDGLVLLAPMTSVQKIKSKPINHILIPIPTSSVVSKLMPRAPLAAMEKNPGPDAW